MLAATKELSRNTGYDELSLVSLSTTDHSRIVEIVDELRDEFGSTLTISLPSMRVDSFSVRIAEAVATRGKHSITFAPEAGTERLRMTINKIVTDDDLYAAAENAFDQGWTNVKMYFMVGQPTETHEDVEGIVTLAKRVREIGRKRHGGRARVRVSTSNFIPKAHTPFQWAQQARPEVLRPRHQYLRDKLKKAGVAFTWEDPEHSLLEAVLSRGDRRLGARDRTRVARRRPLRRVARALRLAALGAARCGTSDLDPAFFAYRERGLRETFPWSHINIGVSGVVPAQRVAEDAAAGDDAGLPQGRRATSAASRTRTPTTASTASTCASPPPASRRRTARACSSRSSCLRSGSSQPIVSV